MRRLAARGALQATDLVWRPGMKDWAPAGTVPGLLEPPLGPTIQRQEEEGPPAAGKPAVPAAPAPQPVFTYVATVTQPQNGLNQREVAKPSSPQETRSPQQGRDVFPKAPSPASRGRKCPNCAFLLPEGAFLLEGCRCPACGTLVANSSGRDAPIQGQPTGGNVLPEGLSVQPAPTPRPGPVPGELGKKPLPTAWLKFYTYVRLPLGALFLLGQILGEPGKSQESALQFVSLVDLCFVILVMIGLIRRAAWGWKLNNILIVLETLAYAYAQSQKQRELGPEFFFVMFLIWGLCWALPNGIYFWKRRHLFGVQY
jgi:hypothetical protein